MVNDGRSTHSYVSNLPFTFSFTPDFCSVVDWGPKEYYNCQKFVSVFHNQANRIWDVLENHNGRIHQVERLESITQGKGGLYDEEDNLYADLGMGGRRKKRKSRRKRKRKKRKSKKRKSKRSKRRKRRTKRR